MKLGTLDTNHGNITISLSLKNKHAITDLLMVINEDKSAAGKVALVVGQIEQACEVEGRVRVLFRDEIFVNRVLVFNKLLIWVQKPSLLD